MNYADCWRAEGGSGGRRRAEEKKLYLPGLFSLEQQHVLRLLKLKDRQQFGGGGAGAAPGALFTHCHLLGQGCASHGKASQGGISFHVPSPPRLLGLGMHLSSFSGQSACCGKDCLGEGAILALQVGTWGWCPTCPSQSCYCFLNLFFLACICLVSCSGHWVLTCLCPLNKDPYTFRSLFLSKYQIGSDQVTF